MHRRVVSLGFSMISDWSSIRELVAVMVEVAYMILQHHEIAPFCLTHARCDWFFSQLAVLVSLRGCWWGWSHQLSRNAFLLQHTVTGTKIIWKAKDSFWGFCTYMYTVWCRDGKRSLGLTRYINIASGHRNRSAITTYYVFNFYFIYFILPVYMVAAYGVVGTRASTIRGCPLPNVRYVKAEEPHQWSKDRGLLMPG